VGNRPSLAQPPGINKYLRAFAPALLMLVFVAGCSSSPTMFGMRVTDSGRLLMDGPPARMTAAAITQDRADEVPLLYNFAIGAGQIPAANSTLPFPAQDLPSQQLALLQVADWRAVTLVGEGYIDGQCDQFIAALNDLERSKKTTLANLNTIQAATVGIMGLALAAQKTIGIVGIAFGLAASLFDTTTSTVLYQLPASGVASIVAAQQQYLRANEDSRLSSISNQGLAGARLNEYLHYCVPVTIEANIVKVLNNTRGTEAGIETSLTTPAVTSAFVHNAAFKASLPTRRELQGQIGALSSSQVEALAREMEPVLAGAGSQVQGLVHNLDPRNARFSNPVIAKRVLETWVLMNNDVTGLQAWADAISRVNPQ
jgi:hypothetical protein